MKPMSKRFRTLLGGGLILLFSLVIIRHAGAQTCVPPPSGLVSWWPGDGNANDIVGPHQGTLLNGAGFAPGKVGQTFSLDGVNDEISIAHTSTLNFGPNDSFTVDAWLKPSTSVLGTQRVAVSLTYVCSRESTGLILLTDGRIDFGIRDSNNISVDLTSPSSIVDGQWHHVVGVRHVGSHTVKLYLDGSLVDSLPDTTTGTFTRADAQDRIGSIPVACPTNRYFWAGEIDEVEIFNRALSSSEIQAIFNAGSAGKCKAATGLDHFKCYKAKGNSPNVTVDLQDQFGVESGVLVQKPQLFCNPVDKNGEGIRNPAAHLTCYKINADSDKREVIATNQFGEQTLEVKKPDLLCVPSDKIDVIP